MNLSYSLHWGIVPLILLNLLTLYLGRKAIFSFCYSTHKTLFIRLNPAALTLKEQITLYYLIPLIDRHTDTFDMLHSVYIYSLFIPITAVLTFLFSPLIPRILTNAILVLYCLYLAIAIGIFISQIFNNHAYKTRKNRR